MTEKQLAEVALAIQNRWNIATFVKMHEIVLLDDEEVDDESDSRVIIVPLDPDQFESGFQVILENLEMERAFKIQRQGKEKFRLVLIDGNSAPTWMRETEAPRAPPEGVFECPHCVPPDTLILGDNKPILEYYVGNVAAGRTGLSEVIQTFVRRYQGEMITIRANGMLPIITTPEHPILVAGSHTIERRHGERLQHEILFSEVRWVAAKDVVAKTWNTDGDYVILPVINGSFERYQVGLFPFIRKEKPNHKGYREYFPLNEDTAWLLGLYAAEGSVTKEVRLSLSGNEGDIGRKVNKIARELGYSTYRIYVKNQNSMLVGITSRVLARAFDEWCGHRAPNKKIPDFVLYHQDEKILRAFLEGYEIGDSYDATNRLRGNKIYRQNSTTSRILAQQLQLAYARLGIWASVCIKHKKTEDLIMGRRCSLHFAYILSYPLEPNAKRQKVRFLDDKVLTPIRNITMEKYDGNVYNIGTTDHTFLVSNAVVHNCGKWFSTEIERSLHQKLHYII